MTRSFSSALIALLLPGGILTTLPDAKGANEARSTPDIEAATRLQVFLDRAEFAPGKIDGRYGEFTLKALSLYREAHGKQAQPRAAKSASKDVAPDVSGLDLASVEPLFVTYTVTETDLQNIGEVPASVPEQAKLESMPYMDAAEAIAEKFHTDVDFLVELNPGRTEIIKAGDTLTVPNVEPFELAAVKDLQPGSAIAAQGANDVEFDANRESAEGQEPQQGTDGKPAAPTTSVTVDVKTNMLTVHESGKLIAAYPVTIGSAQTESPVGEWIVRGVAKMPKFRYDEAMLKKGERSSDFHMLPPGPNNPVGVIWIALNKKGIGLHGTSEPDAIGRSASHGCVRLANWDVVRLAAKVKTGVPVSIR